MSKQHYFFQLIPPRATFPQDITDAEKLLMQQHSVYFQEQFAAGKVLLYGPVMAASGAFGLAVLEVENEVENEAEARQFGQNDPSVKAGCYSHLLRDRRGTTGSTRRRLLSPGAAPPF
jgi:uncharacterized protein YciI